MKNYILTGFNASGSIHLGHKLTFDTVIFLQKKYKIPVYIPISDDESYVTKKIKDQKQGMKNALLIAKQMLALGFDKKLTKIFIHQQHTKFYNFAIKLSTKTTLSEVKAIYGFNDSTNPGLMFYPIIQAADILYPEHLHGKSHVLVPIGIDQDPHVRLSRDIAAKVGLIKPSTIHLKYLHGLKGGKMSASKPGSAIFLNEDPKKARKYIMSAFTGGRDTIEEQKKVGGQPKICIVFEYLDTFFPKEAKKVKQECKKSKLTCGDCKKILADLVEKYLKDFQSKVKKEEKNLKKVLLSD
jgi:tryptophanyl-tRNA synthetase